MSRKSDQQLQAEPIARMCYAVLGLLASVGVILSLRNGILDTPGLFDLNQLFFFTFMSNLIVAVTSLILAFRPRMDSTLFHVIQIAGIVCIIVTGLVFNILLRSGPQPTALAVFHDTVQHIVTPIAAPALWLFLGPLGKATGSRILWSALIPATWLAVTLIRGHFTGWYPYTILDVNNLGYQGIAPYLGGIAGLYAVVGLLMWLVDRTRGQS